MSHQRLIPLSRNMKEESLRSWPSFKIFRPRKNISRRRLLSTLGDS